MKKGMHYDKSGNFKTRPLWFSKYRFRKITLVFKEVIGLEETEEADGVHYLRAWGDFEHHTLTLRLW